MSPVADSDPLPAPFEKVARHVGSNLDTFATGNADFRTAALLAAKYAFDSSLKSEPDAFLHIAQLLRSIVPEEPIQTRSSTRRGASGKRRRSSSPDPPSQHDSITQVAKRLKPTALDELYVEGMDDDQVWSQLELRAKGICEVVEALFEEEFHKEEAQEASVSDDHSHGGEDEQLSDEMDGEDEGEAEWESGSLDDEEEEESESSDDDDVASNLGEGVTPLRDNSEEDQSDLDLNLDAPSRVTKQRRRHPTLDDGFFSLAEFNAETEAAESRSSSRGHLADDDESDDDEGSIDLFKQVDETNQLSEDDLEAATGGELLYKDFFAPPPRPAKASHIKSKNVQLSTSPPKSRATKVRFHEEVRVKNIKSNRTRSSLLREQIEAGEDFDLDADEDGFGEFADGDAVEDSDSDSEGSQENSEDGSEEESVDGQETIDRLRGDLFADDDDAVDTDLSTHAARQLKLNDQIKALEEENVGPKDWVLLGEASSKSRPLNSLLEEDLAFDRTTRAVPVITEEKVQSLESLIKARILDNRFDDVVRQRPVDDKPFLPSRMFELQDTKSAQSLAQIYEDDYMAAQGGTAKVDDRDGRLKKEHGDLEKMWETISYKLDALSNAHFTPKAPTATISTVSNIASASLESALPTTKSTSTLLAPEEIFASSTNDARDKNEMTPAEKRALRGKERKKRKKQRDHLELSVDKFAKSKNRHGKGGVKAEKERALKSVVKVGKGVTVVGKKNEKTMDKGKVSSSKKLKL